MTASDPTGAGPPEGAGGPGRLGRLLVAPALGLLRFYQKFLSPLKPPTCRFRPTCSSYAIEALSRHGPWRGAWLTVRRVLKCHPFHPGGYDPVPDPRAPHRPPEPEAEPEARPAVPAPENMTSSDLEEEP